ncbi:hypothetical protein BKA70DRAFT_774904 [Coprinopsis sp. MPI-PUGE-AT-0042]|nr:hypothetical protein BKA70DRAFT_774904 [Coprinopsis sp. MPI-PUGE-AT-0042]
MRIQPLCANPVETRELKPPVPGYKRPRVTVPLGHFEISDDDKQPGPSRRPAPPRSQSGKGSSSSATAPPTTEIIDLCSDAEPESPVCNKRPDIRTANEGGTIVILTSEDETAPPSIPIEAARRNRQRPRPTPSQRKRRSAPISPPHEEAPPLSQLFSPAPSPVSTTPATAAISTSAFTTLPRLSFTGTQRQASLELSGSESEGISKKKAPPRDYKQGELQAIYNRALATVSGPRIPERKPIALCRDPLEYTNPDLPILSREPERLRRLHSTNMFTTRCRSRKL